jgi:hypothetical protein
MRHTNLNEMRIRIGQVKQWWRYSRLEDVSGTETQKRGTKNRRPG